MSKSYEYNVFFTIEERGPENSKGSKAKLLIDNEGHICGIFATYKHAKAAMYSIRRNIIKELKRRDYLKSLQ